ncbi:MAG TPA: hypothetical protein VFR58_06265 [Flavisolibacter sp.]|nr:hypothetical protein [Flavisolibacter sp.]
MGIAGYFLCIISLENRMNVMPTVIRLAGPVHSIMSGGVQENYFDLMFVKAVEKTEAGIQALQNNPDFREVIAFAVVDPPGRGEVMALRKLFERLDWDTDETEDEEVLAFIRSKLAGRYTLILEDEPQLQGFAPDLLRIRSTQELVEPDVFHSMEPYFVYDWPESNEVTVVTETVELTDDDESIVEVGGQPIEKEEQPSLPAKFERMTDDELRQMINTRGTRMLKHAGFDIERGPGQLTIIIKMDGAEWRMVFKSAGDNK